MINKPKLKSFLTLFPIDDATWGLQGGAEELSRIKLRDPRAIRTFGALLPYLTGLETTDALLDRMAADGIDREAAEQLLASLEQASLIEEADQSALLSGTAGYFFDQIAFFSRYGADAGTKYQSVLAGKRVAVVGDGRLAQALVRRMVESGFGGVVLLAADCESARASIDPARFDHRASMLEVVELHRETIWPENADGGPPDLVILAQDRHDPALLEAMDACSKRLEMPWMLVRALNPLEGWVGPLFVPDETACYLSLDARLKGNMPFFEEYQAFERYLQNEGRSSAPCGGLNAFFELLSSIAAIEIVKYVAGFTVPILAGRFLTVDLEDWSTELHDVLRLPRLGLDSPDKPLPFPWKEVPYGDTKTPRA